MSYLFFKFKGWLANFFRDTIRLWSNKHTVNKNLHSRRTFFLLQTQEAVTHAEHNLHQIFFTSVFFMNKFSPGTLVSHWGIFKIDCVVLHTIEKFIGSHVDTADYIISRIFINRWWNLLLIKTTAAMIYDNSDNFLPVSLTSCNNISLPPTQSNHK